MTDRVLLASLLAGAISASALMAVEQPGQSESTDPPPGDRQREEERFQRHTLKGDCQKLLDRQIALANGTRDLHKVIEATADKQPRPADQQAALKLSGLGKAMVIEANDVIDKLETEGSAVAFAEVFGAVRDDMKRVLARLETADVGSDTQALEEDIINALKGIIEALKSH